MAVSNSLSASGLLVAGQDLTNVPVTLNGIETTFGGMARGSVQPVHLRAPLASDDTLAGYSVGDFWVATVVGAGRNIWQCVQAATGNAMWLPYSGGLGLPVDAVGGVAPLCVGGTRKFVRAYAGNLLRVVRASDSATLDIGFLADGSLDAATMESFGALTTLTVDIVYDQSGNTNHFTQTTAALRPEILRRAQTGNTYSVVFNSCRQGTITNKNMVINTLAAGNTAATSMFLVARSANAISQTELMQLSGTSAARNIWFGYSSSLNQWRSGVTGTGLTPLPGKPAASPQIIGTISSGTDHTMFVENTSLARGSTLGVTAWNGGFIGYSLDDTPGNGYFESPFFCVYGRALTATERANLFGSLYYNLGLIPQARDTIAFYGDSITESYGGQHLQSYGRQTMDLLTLPMRHYEVGAFGQTSEAISVQATMTSYLSPITGPGRNVLVIFAGTNSYNGSATGATVFNSFLTITAQARAMGFNKVLWATTLPRTSFSGAQELLRQDGNALLRNGASLGCDGLVDFAADATMGLSATASNTSYFIDGIHPSDLGYTYLASMIAPAVAKMAR